VIYLHPDCRDFLDTTSKGGKTSEGISRNDAEHQERIISTWIGDEFNFRRPSPSSEEKIERQLELFVRSIFEPGDLPEPLRTAAWNSHANLMEFAGALHADPYFRFTPLARESIVLADVRFGEEVSAWEILNSTIIRERYLRKEEPKTRGMNPPFVMSPRLAWRAACLNPSWRSVFDEVCRFCQKRQFSEVEGRRFGLSIPKDPVPSLFDLPYSASSPRSGPENVEPMAGLRDEKYYSVAQAAQIAGVKSQTVRGWARDGKLKARKLGETAQAQYKIFGKNLREYLEGKRR